MSGIFISYRREDCAPYAGRLYDWISQHFGKENIFIDVDTIQPGEDFVEAVEQRVGGCDALLALIGKDWLNCRDEDGNRRLDNPGDFVRVEIVAALNRGVRLIPVLVEGARMPAERDLPEGLAKLARRQALELSFTRFHQDANRLIETLEKALAAAEERRRAEQDRLTREKAGVPRRASERADSLNPWAIQEELPTQESPSPPRQRRAFNTIAAAAAIAAIVGVAGWYILKQRQRPTSQTGASASTAAAQPPSPELQLPAIEAFTADPTVLESGGSAMLRWSVLRASSVTLGPGFGPVPASGTRVVTPESSTTYELVVSGPGGATRSSVAITVQSVRRPPASAGPPTITEFAADPNPVVRDRQTTLRWNVRGGESVTLGPGIGKVGATGTRVITPQSSTSYELVAHGPGGVTRRSLPITVESAALPATGPPTIEQFTVHPNPVVRDQQATLQWTIRGGNSVTLSPGIGAVAATGTWAVTPHSSTTYELAARGPGGVTTARVELKVTAPPAPPITIDFSASSPIQRGESSMLRWSVTNAEHISIDQGIGRVDNVGSRKLSPSETTVYKLSASGSGQEKQATAQIVVNAQPKPAIATTGTLVWKGDLQAFGVLTIDATTVARGTLHGALPGLPVRISVPPEMRVLEAPGSQNGWRRLVLRNNARSRDDVKIVWQLLP